MSEGTRLGMKNACSTFFALILTLCLSFYGPVAMASEGTGAVYSMEICANGVAKTVVVGVDGVPVEPAQNCADCLTCCHVVGAVPPTFDTVISSIVPLVTEVDGPLGASPVLSKRNLLPVPRGPPGRCQAMPSLRT